MKIRLKFILLFGVLLAVFLVGGSIASALFSGTSVNLQKGLVGHWKFDGNAKDATPNGNDGTVAGNAAVTANDRKAKTNSAIALDGTGDFVSVSNSSLLNFGASQDFSISAWVTVSAFAGDTYDRVVFKGDGAGQTKGYTLYTTKGGLFGFSVRDATSGGNSALAQASGLSLNTWYHIAGTADRDGNATLYVNGVSSATASMSLVGDIDVAASGLFMGAIGTGGQNAFNGSIDDVRVYNRALSSAEITALYDSYNPGLAVSDLQKGLVGHWKFDGNAKDDVPSGNNAALSGDAAVTASDRKGRSNKALAIDGTGDYALVADSSLFNFGASQDFSVSAWVNVSAFAGDFNDGIVFKGLSSGSTKGYYLRTTTSGQARFSVRDATSGGNAAEIVASGVSLGTWYHLAGTADRDGNATLYVNGTSSGTASMSSVGDIDVGGSSLIIGAVNTTPSNVFNGSIDDVRVYNRALSSAEVTALYDSYNPELALSDFANGLVGYWKFNGNANDSSGNANDCAVNGATLASDRNGNPTSAYVFDAVNDYLDCGNNSVLDIQPGGEVSFDWWSKSSQSKTLFSKGQSGVFRNYTIGTLSSGTRIIAVYNNASRSGTVDIVNTSWNHFTVVMTSTSTTWYKNGALVETQTGQTNTFKTGTANFLIGANEVDQVGLGGFFNGTIDEVRMYNRALSASEISALHEFRP